MQRTDSIPSNQRPDELRADDRPRPVGTAPAVASDVPNRDAFTSTGTDTDTRTEPQDQGDRPRTSTPTHHADEFAAQPPVPRSEAVIVADAPSIEETEQSDLRPRQRTMTPQGTDARGARLLGEPAVAEFQTRWHTVQASFVDDPSASVRSAGSLVDELAAAVTSALADKRSAITPETGADTESQRNALKHHRELFQRLLEV